MWNPKGCGKGKMYIYRYKFINNTNKPTLMRMWEYLTVNNSISTVAVNFPSQWGFQKAEYEAEHTQMQMVSNGASKTQQQRNSFRN